MRGVIADGAGNRFLLVDALVDGAPRDPAAAARAICAPLDVDGLLVLAPSDVADVAMILYNSDGSRPEACGNGLRCVALAAARAGHVITTRFRVETDAGVRAVEVESDAVRVSVGGARIIVAQLEACGVRGTVVDVGNPHFVVRGAHDVERLGPVLATDAAFAGGTNVEFVGEDLAVRVWERGVGETRACGTGACATALVAVEQWGHAWPVAVKLPGGTLTVDRAPDGALWLSGPTRLEASVEVPGIE